MAEAHWGCQSPTRPSEQDTPHKGAQLASWEGEGRGEDGGVPGLVNETTDDSRNRRLQV